MKFKWCDIVDELPRIINSKLIMSACQEFAEEFNKGSQKFLERCKRVAVEWLKRDLELGELDSADYILFILGTKKNILPLEVKEMGNRIINTRDIEGLLEIRNQLDYWMNSDYLPRIVGKINPIDLLNFLFQIQEGLV